MKIVAISKAVFVNFMLVVMIAHVSVQTPIRATLRIRGGSSGGMCWRKCGPWQDPGGGDSGNEGDGGNTGSGDTGGDTTTGSAAGQGPPFGFRCPPGQSLVDVDACTTCCR